MKLLGAGLALAAVGGYGLIGECVGAQANQPEAAPATGQFVEVVELRSEPGYALRQAYTGELRAARSSELAFELDGKLVQVGVDEGRIVAAGDELARLDTRRLDARRAELAAERRRTAAVLEELENGPRTEVIAAARSEVHALEAELLLTQVRLERRGGLVARDVVPPEELDVATMEEARTKARLAGARARLEELEAGTRAERIDAQRAALAGLDASIAALDIDLADSVLRAPFDARVAARHVDEGEVLAAGTPVVRLVERGAIEAWVGLPERKVAEVLARADLSLEVDGRRVAVTERRLLPEIDESTRTATLVLSLDPREAADARPGQVARLRLATRVETPGFWLPTTALREADRGLWSCFLASDEPEGTNGALAERRCAQAGVDVRVASASPANVPLEGPGVEASPAEASSIDPAHSADSRKATRGTPPTERQLRVERADVEVLHTDGDRVFVRGTLLAGDRVITGGLERLVPGQRVRLDRRSALARGAERAR